MKELTKNPGSRVCLGGTFGTAVRGREDEQDCEVFAIEHLQDQGG